MDRMPDTAQPDHAQVQDHLSARDRPRHARAFEPLRKHDLARGLRYTAADRQFLAPVKRILHPSTAPFEVAIGFIIELGLARSEEHTSELQSLAYLVCRL